MQQEIGEVCLPKSRVAISFQRRRATQGPSERSAGRTFSPTARETKPPCQSHCATSQPTISAHRSTEESWNHRCFPNNWCRKSDVVTIACATVSHDHRYSEERRTCAITRFKRPREIATESSDERSTQRQGPREPFGCI